ncbi:hypothetical protein PDE_06073 [Penicillium oxalicum 114-2]|uniref:Uncharacterized protein n=1 Tax=Penicillium oxalicum (strain 114-2 / CGMCC 5302) TaxID=933388 RepID=S8AXN5_PENO1|nr:hypothetical protein PDE_06073 [Penicillium oxalicum 114-2]
MLHRTAERSRPLWLEPRASSEIFHFLTLAGQLVAIVDCLAPSPREFSWQLRVQSICRMSHDRGDLWSARDWLNWTPRTTNNRGYSAFLISSPGALFWVGNQKPSDYLRGKNLTLYLSISLNELPGRDASIFKRHSNCSLTSGGTWYLGCLELEACTVGAT